MNNAVALYRESCASSRVVARAGTTTIEMLVAFSLLTTALTVSLPLVVRHQRILVTARHYRLAVEELSNQIERLTALPATEVSAELERLEPSAFTAERLPGAELSGRLEPADLGERLTLRIVWDEPQRRDAPVTLAAWIFPEATAAAGAAERTAPPTEDAEP